MKEVIFVTKYWTGSAPGYGQERWEVRRAGESRISYHLSKEKAIQKAKQHRRPGEDIAVRDGSGPYRSVFGSGGGAPSGSDPLLSGNLEDLL